MHRRVAVLALATLIVAGCARKRAAPAPAASSSVAEPAPVVSAAIDALGPDEIAQGQDRAFGIVLPRHTIVTKRFDDSVFAYGDYTVEQLIRYLDARMVGGVVSRSGETYRLKGKPRAPGNPPLLDVEMTRPNGGNTHFVVRDVTPPPIEPNLTEEERWKRAGIGKDGKSTVRE